ncbi:patatin-like phospholipase family protein [Oleisolibacter albus]|uniref:patatin-like phospholipase family protein n=1 Tax=Oleisolibacter albus TaxID=2171757 RepID=UPI00138F9F3F|nr:patatin-like phospholipase family protein [Oleisolibacter albus]
MTRMWTQVGAVWGVLVTVRFSLVFTLLFLVVMLGAGQARDLLWLVGEQGWSWHGAPSLLLAALFYAVNAWYWARIAVYARNAPSERLTPVARWLERHLPRLLGSLPLVALAWSLWSAVERSNADMAPRTVAQLHQLAWVALALAILFYGFTLLRRHLLVGDWQAERNHTIRLERAAAIAEAAPQPGAAVSTAYSATWGRGSVDAGQDPRPVARALPFRALPPLTRVLIRAFLPAFVGVVLLTVLLPAGFGRFWGTAPLFLVWGGGFVGVGSALSYFSSRTGVPFILWSLCLALVFGALGWNADHQLRLAEVQGDVPAPAVEGFARWFGARADEIAARGADDPYPVVIVASAGGGIRAAYWTSYSLARLTDANPALARHVLGLSGVSGGSVGIGAYAASLMLDGDRTTDPAQTAPAQVPSSHTARVLDYYRAEFLSPLLTGFLIPDLAQRFLPVAVRVGGTPLLDRARGFEIGLARSPGAIAGPFDQPVARLYADGATTLPYLFFNTTQVQSGRHAVIAPLRLDPALFPGIVDLSCLTPRLRMATAAHTSARFPYLSPAGEVEWQMAADCPSPPPEGFDWLYVDGGYYDNSGTLTALGIARTALAAYAAAGRANPALTPEKIRLVFLYVANDPEMTPLPPAVARTPVGPAAGAAPATPPSTALQDLTAPITTILSVRSTLGQEELIGFKRRVDGRTVLDEAPLTHPMQFLMLRLPASVPDVPLGWVLSDLSKREIRDSLDRCPGAGLPNDVAAAETAGITPAAETCAAWSALSRLR